MGEFDGERAEESKRGVTYPGQGLAEGGHQVESTFSTLEGGMGAMEEIAEGGSMFEAAHHAMHGLSPIMTILGGGLGAANLGSGIAHMQVAARRGDLTGSEGSQGALDAASGATGIANLVGLAATGAVSGPLALAAGITGLAASGNEYAEDHGWYGKHYNDKTHKLENATFLNSIGDNAKAGWRWGHEAGGDGFAGDALGTILGGIGGGVGTVVNTGRAIGGSFAAANEAWGKVIPRKSPDWMPKPFGIDTLSLGASARR